MVTHPTRRRLLQLSGVSVTASLAGCSQFDLPGSADNDPELDVGEEPDIDPEDGITAIVQPDEEALGELEQEIVEDVEAGELDQQEMQAEFQQRQMQLTAARAVEFEDEFADADDELSIEAGVAEQGAFLLDGPDERLLGTLRDGEVWGLIPGEEYGRLLEQQQQQEALEEEAPEDPEDPEEAPEPDEDVEPEPEDADDDADETDESDESDEADEADESDDDADDEDADSDADGDSENETEN